ncbi:unnamed protein product [Menidia menidia]|uniref:(Atlantic silverside) hypothetical protein n=1 Tax=Menidia menidia TaxID=238744 RepID=A0A8S4A6P7_9TELE|nr:unnamed protein product [Menidia menidia]
METLATDSTDHETSAQESGWDETSEHPGDANSDSGESLFITQAPVPEAVRSERRRRSTFTSTQKDDDTSDSSSDENSKTDKKKIRKKGKVPMFSFPFLAERANEQSITELPRRQNNRLHKSLMRGYFECVRTMWNGYERGDLLTSLPTIDMNDVHIPPISEVEEEEPEDEEFKVVVSNLLSPEKERKKMVEHHKTSLQFSVAEDDVPCGQDDCEKKTNLGEDDQDNCPIKEEQDIEVWDAQTSEKEIKAENKDSVFSITYVQRIDEDERHLPLQSHIVEKKEGHAFSGSSSSAATEDFGILKSARNSQISELIYVKRTEVRGPDSGIHSSTMKTDGEDQRRPYTCNLCDKNFRIKSILTRHMKTHTKEKPHRCSICGEGFVKLSYLQKHMSSHPGQRPYNMWEKIHQAFSSNQSHEDPHRREDVSPYAWFSVAEDDVPCGQDDCEKKTNLGEDDQDNCPIKEEQDIEVWDAQTSEKEIKAENKDSVFSITYVQRIDEDERHLAIQSHIVEKKEGHALSGSSSPAATEDFGILKSARNSQISELIYVKRTEVGRPDSGIHSNTMKTDGEDQRRPYTCNLCDKNFRIKSILTRHMKTHTKEKPHRCSICGEGFVKLSYLQKHMSSHPGQRPYKFIRRSHLINHMKTHTGEKMYPHTHGSEHMTD